MIRTECLYLAPDASIGSKTSLVEISQDLKGYYLIFDRTVFYPQGGGQPSDVGSVAFDSGEKVDVHHVASIEDSIRHYVAENPTHLKIGASGFMAVNQERRSYNTRCHSAGHLLGHVFEQLNPQAKAAKGHHFPGECYVEFIFPKDGVVQEIASLNKAIEEVTRKNLSSKTRFVEKDAIKSLNLPYEVPDNKPLRIHEIDGYKSIPCGGTHVNSLQEIGQLIVSKMKVKGDRAKVSYEIK